MGHFFPTSVTKKKKRFYNRRARGFALRGRGRGRGRSPGPR